jgi:hypothetical protein
MVFSLLKNDNGIYNLSRPIRGALAKLIAEVAKRQYPQLWPTCITEIGACWAQGPQSRAEVCISSLELLVQVNYFFHFLSFILNELKKMVFFF